MAGDTDALADGEEPFADLLATGDPTADPVALDPDSDLASIQFTGGTTGRSKGAILTHANHKVRASSSSGTPAVGKILRREL